MPHLPSSIPTSAQLVGTWVTLPIESLWLLAGREAPLFPNTAACLSLMVYLRQSVSIYQHWEKSATTWTR